MREDVCERVWYYNKNNIYDFQALGEVNCSAKSEDDNDAAAQ